MHPLCPVWQVNTGPRQFSEVDLCMICTGLDEGGDRGSFAVWAGPGGSGWVYLAVRLPGCVLQSCGWRSCAYLRRRPAGLAARAGGRPGGHRVAAPPAQRPPQTTSSGTGQSPPGLQQTRLQLQWGGAGRLGLLRTGQPRKNCIFSNYLIKYRCIQASVWIYSTSMCKTVYSIYWDKSSSAYGFWVFIKSIHRPSLLLSCRSRIRRRRCAWHLQKRGPPNLHPASSTQTKQTETANSLHSVVFSKHCSGLFLKE